MKNSGTSRSKIASALETSTLTEVELSKYCRAKGLYPEQIKSEKKLVSQVIQKSRVKEQRADKKRIKDLERKLRSKEEALAETATLLILGKSTMPIGRKKKTATYADR